MMGVTELLLWPQRSYGPSPREMESIKAASHHTSAAPSCGQLGPSVASLTVLRRGAVE